MNTRGCARNLSSNPTPSEPPPRTTARRILLLALAVLGTSILASIIIPGIQCIRAKPQPAPASASLPVVAAADLITLGYRLDPNVITETEKDEATYGRPSLWIGTPAWDRQKCQDQSQPATATDLHIFATSNRDGTASIEAEYTIVWRDAVKSLEEPVFYRRYTSKATIEMTDLDRRTGVPIEGAFAAKFALLTNGQLAHDDIRPVWHQPRPQRSQEQ